MSIRDPRGYWVMQAPVISTGHLAKPVMDTLDAVLPGEDFHGALCMPGTYGAMLHCADFENLDPDAPECLRSVLGWGAREGFEWLRLDRDGDVIAGLPEYPW